MALNSLVCLQLIVQTIFDKSGFNILVLDLRKFSTAVDYVIIAEGFVNKHVTALADEVIVQARKIGLDPSYVEGRNEGDWVAIDFSFITVHLFQPAWREKYQLESLWRAAEIVDIPINTHSQPASVSYQ